MSSKKILLIILIVLLVVSFPIGYFIFDNLFPKANSITCPKEEAVMSVSVSEDKDVVHLLDETQIEALLQNIKDSKPTRHLALNEVPGVENYYTIVIQTEERELYYYIYEEEARVYLFSPYEGVYEVEQTILEDVLEQEDYDK